MPDAQFLIQSNIPGAAGLFLLHSVPGPYTELSDFAESITDRQLRVLAVAQRTWLSIDNVRIHTSEEDAYRFIGRTLARLAPPDAAVLVHPSKPLVLRFDGTVRRRLANGDRFP